MDEVHDLSVSTARCIMWRCSFEGQSCTSMRSQLPWISIDGRSGWNFASSMKHWDSLNWRAGGSMLAIAAHSLGEMLMPHEYMRPADGQPAGVEIAFLTRAFRLLSPKRLRRGRSRSRHQGEWPGGSRSLMYGRQRVRSLVSRNHQQRPNECSGFGFPRYRTVSRHRARVS